MSLRARLISSYLVILGSGGLATSLVGSWIVSSTIMMQARRAVDHDFATARTVYDQQAQELQLAAEFAASGAAVEEYFENGRREGASAYLDEVRMRHGFDFLGLADDQGRVLLWLGDSARSRVAFDSSLARAALAGRTAAGTELWPASSSAAEQMAIAAAAPVEIGGRCAGAVYGGVFLNGRYAIVDRVWNLLYRGDRLSDVDRGAVTIFARDVRISTTARRSDGSRAIGAQAPEAARSVLTGGRIWSGRAYIVNDWYISEYAPIRDYDGRVIGMLSVGILESAYTAIRNRVILSFFGIATAGFLVILAITYYMIRNITRPIGEMVAATRSISAGNFDQEVRADTPGELALLAASFNAMLESLRQMKSDLEGWGRTLEEKVRERTDELAAMQARVSQSERLASLGMLAAGVAHEINNPLGAILALTTLTAEELPEGSPNHENLTEVVRQADRCRDIVKGLLQFSRQSKGNLEPVNLNDVLRNTLSLLQKQSIFFNVKLVCQFADPLPSVIADRSQMQQVFLNILMNALQAMDERGSIRVETRHEPLAEFVEVSISDTGRGIPPDQIGRIFDPFFTTKKSGAGTGLGLSIAYGIVTTHRGSISVRSEPGAGSTFVVRLPTEFRSGGGAALAATSTATPAAS